MTTVQEGRSYPTRSGGTVGPISSHNGELAFGRYRYTAAGNCFVRVVGGDQVMKPDLDIMFDPLEGFVPDTIAVADSGANQDGGGPNDERLIAADLLAALKECRDAEVRRRADLKPGAPATQYTEERLARVNSAIDNAEGKGIRAQSFAERERDLLEANNRYLEEARTARRAFAELDGQHEAGKVAYTALSAKLDAMTAERDHWRSVADDVGRQLDAVANRSDEERGMVWLVQSLGAHQRALAGILPYAESRAEDMIENDGENPPEFEESPETVKAVDAVNAAKKLLGRA